MIQLIERAKRNPQRIAIRSNNYAFTYQQLLADSESVAATLLKGKADLKEERIAYLVTPSFEYVLLQWGIWRAGGIAVPLCTKHPFTSIEYVINDTKASVVICSKEYEELLAPFKKRKDILFISTTAIKAASCELPDIAMDRRAIILYTSGTTGSPKGVVSRHQNIEAQITSLVTSWEWSKKDHILNILPLHHVHRIVNILSCALWSGACCEFLPKFNVEKVFDILKGGSVNIFMAVPTIYYKLIAQYNTYSPEIQKEISAALSKFRFMVSGSVALPISVLETWRTISGHTLLERYGMTEMGMAISNPYNGERRPGHIGKPLSKVQIRIADEADQVVADGQTGEIQVKGPNVFQEYSKHN